MDHFTVDPLLAYSQYTAEAVPSSGQPRQLNWDLRESSVNARRTNPDEAVTFADLGRPATQPNLDVLDITCGLFPSNWVIEVRRPEGIISVSDVMEAIRAALLRRVSHAEYSAFTEDQQLRIAAVFNSRWLAASDPTACRLNGILRLDCLLQHTVFAGLTASTDTPCSFILSLRRHGGHSRTPSAESQFSAH